MITDSSVIPASHLPNNSLASQSVHQAHHLIVGAGCAGLSLVMHLLQHPVLGKQKIILLDPDAKNNNDRTWCFWEQGQGLFESVVHHRWHQLWFKSPGFSKLLNIQPYTYKQIRGIDFYNYCKTQLAAAPNVQWIQSGVKELHNQDGNVVAIDEEGNTYKGQYAFNSIPPAAPQMRPSDIWMLQHFKGWVVKTEAPVFNPDEAVMMDFRTDQTEGATFFYVLPVSPTEALVEYTLFSEKLLSAEKYDAALKNYLSDHYTSAYQIKEQEFGIIPMTTYRFSKGNENIINIGTAGGYTKGSSGYTFQNIQKSSATIIAAMAAGRHPAQAKRPHRRFHFYDRVLLQVLKNGKLKGRDVFATMYRNNPPHKVQRFLDNDSSFFDDLRIISRMPKLPFTQAALQQF